MRSRVARCATMTSMETATDLTVNEWADTFDHPALQPGPDGVDRSIIAACAAEFAAQLLLVGSAHIVIEPDDGTRYEVVACRRWGASSAPPYVFASNHGSMHAWNGTPTIHPEYAAKKWANGRSWTGVVFALFLNEVAARLEAS